MQSVSYKDPPPLIAPKQPVLTASSAEVLRALRRKVSSGVRIIGCFWSMSGINRYLHKIVSVPSGSKA